MEPDRPHIDHWIAESGSATTSTPGARRVLLFFFSSRRRHTRLQGDWSSDVCSSDLLAADVFEHTEEPVALLAHPDKYLLEEARRAVTVNVEPLPPVFAVEDSRKVFKDRKSVV